jgi:hypothetical protein
VRRGRAAGLAVTVLRAVPALDGATGTDLNGAVGVLLDRPPEVVAGAAGVELD